MKTNFLNRLTVAGCVIAVATSSSAFAQNSAPKDEKEKTHITIITEQNGSRTVFDTAFDSNENSVHDFLRQNNLHGIEVPVADELPELPEPPDLKNLNFSFNFDEKDLPDHFELKFDFDSEIINSEEFKKGMENLKVEMEKSKIEMQKSFDEMKMSEDEMEQVIEEIKKAKNELEKNIKEGKKTKIIMRKSSDNTVPDTDNADETGFVFLIDDAPAGECMNVIADGKPGSKCCMMIINKNDETVDTDGLNHTPRKIVIVKREITDPENETTSPKQSLKKKYQLSDTSNSTNDYQLRFKEFNVFPNPSNGSFDLSFNLDEEGPVSIKIIDLSGREVFSENINDFSGYYSRKIELGNNASGTYLLQIKRGNYWKHYKIVKKK